MTLNENRVNLPKSVTLKLKDKFKIRNMMKREPLLFHIMVKQGFTRFILASNTQETVQVNIDTFPEWLMTWHPVAVSYVDSSHAIYQRTQ